MRKDIINIKQILKKYYTGNSSIQEERLLRNYFKSNGVPDELQSEKLLFEALLDDCDVDPLNISELEYMLKAAVNSEKNSVRRKSYRFINLITGLSVAASFVLAIGIGWLVLKDSNPSIKFVDTYDNPAEAYQETKRLLMKISSTINNASSHMEPLAKLEIPSKALEPLGEMSQHLEILKRIESFGITKDIPMVKDILWREEVKNKE